jgi:hypothetical protein
LKNVFKFDFEKQFFNLCFRRAKTAEPASSVQAGASRRVSPDHVRPPPRRGLEAALYTQVAPLSIIIDVSLIVNGVCRELGIQLLSLHLCVLLFTPLRGGGRVDEEEQLHLIQGRRASERRGISS